MHRWKHRKLLVVSSVIVVAASAFILSADHSRVDFSSQVKPILNKHCISCHGGVKQQAKLSFLFREEALSKAKSGKYAIVPGDPENSEMIRRLGLTDPEERMPYKHEPLPEQDVATLRKWIQQGAEWGDHWSYLPVEKPKVPLPQSSFLGLVPARKIDWVKNNIDYFIYDKLRRQKLQPSPEADKATLLRRVSLDLTGLPPMEALAAKYLSDTSSMAYENLVDALLSSPHYGERWTSMWLDIARYADTKGYERDDSRTIWEYRDWVIKAFNADKPYNTFLIEQLAGDLLPNATDQQFIATAFHRNTMTNDEGGIDNEEFRTAAVLDRVNTTWQALMGTTFSCVQCHAHPYDPFKHDDYYKFLAFYNNSRDENTAAEYPLLREYNAPDSAKLLEVVNWVKQNSTSQEARKIYLFLKTWQPAINSIQTDSFTNSELADTKWLAFRNHAVCRLKNVDLNNKSELIYRHQGFVPGGIWTIRLDKPDGPVLKSINVQKSNGWTISSTRLPVAGGVHNLYFTYTNPNLKKPDDNGMMFDWFHFTNPLPGKDKAGYAEVEKKYWELLTKTDVATTPVMMDNLPDMHRTSYLFEKGNWLVKGKKVEPDVPASLNPFPANMPRNRLGLAVWLTDKRNPLTARTMVNRLWEQLFGGGLVETLEDMGTQGAEPTHKELLDHLSWQFMYDYKWSMKRLLKQMVMSAAYRQDSRVSKEVLEKDPTNSLYQHGVRVRLSAEQLRDQALTVSGLLSGKMYGPSVMPWQPAGIWLSPWSDKYWIKSSGEDQYRRSVYTYWKRTAPYPSMISFDAAAREVCTPRRIRTNTPLQALVTLNDSVFLEASRHLAYRMKERAVTKNVRQYIDEGYELLMLKPASPQKLAALENLYTSAYAKFKNDPDRTCEMTGEVNKSHNNPETAALVVVANALFNLDEVVTKN